MGKKRIMIVEDEIIVARDMRMALEDIGYDVCSVVDTGENAIKKAEEDRPDLVLMDIKLAGEIDGIDAAGEINSRFDIPSIYVTAHPDEEIFNRAKETEPFVYLHKPVDYNQLHNNIELALYKNGIDKKLKENNAQLERIMNSIINTIVNIVKLKAPYIGNHQQNVAKLSTALAKDMSLSADRIDGIRLAARIHDLGLMSIPYEILIKPVRLIDVEYAVYKTHPKSGYELLKDIEFFWPVAEIVLQHHENMDGSGYPSGLKGEEILLEARILNVANFVERVIYGHPNKPSGSVEEALEAIDQGRNILYDSDVVDACLRVFREKGFVFE